MPKGRIITAILPSIIMGLYIYFLGDNSKVLRRYIRSCYPLLWLIKNHKSRKNRTTALRTTALD